MEKIFFTTIVFFSYSFSQQSTLTINVVVPSPINDTIYITGDNSQWGDWNPQATPMKKINDSLWSIQNTFPTPSFLEFKITRGSWSNQAIYQQGIIPNNTRCILKNDTTITLYPIGWSNTINSSIGKIIGTVKYHKAIKGKGLNYSRDVIVWLPPSYYKSKNNYPVLYMHDGQNIIDPSTSFLGYDWRIDDVVDSLIKMNQIQEIIIIGIYNTPDRTLEYSDTELGKNYANFVVNKLKPFIDSTYRTKPDKKNTAIMGSSMGGLISFLFAWWYPNTFSSAGCLSSAFLVDDNKILKEVKNYNGKKKNVRFYLDDGGVGLDEKLKPGYDEMITLLKNQGYKKGNDLEYFYDETAEHNEQAWAKRIWRPLKFMFGK